MTLQSCIHIFQHLTSKMMSPQNSILYHMHTPAHGCHEGCEDHLSAFFVAAEAMQWTNYSATTHNWSQWNISLLWLAAIHSTTTCAYCQLVIVHKWSLILQQDTVTS